jgi:hypothetical protein
MSLVDIRNAFNPRFWLPIAAASAVVDTAGLFVWRYTSAPSSPINKWYDRFGLAAYGADILSIMIGVILTQLATSWWGGAWSPLLFCAAAVAIQMTHDVGFAALVRAFPRGHNSIMDLMKEYVNIDFAQGILIVDGIYMIIASLLTMLLSSVNPGVSWITLILTLYTTMYILYTRP